MNFRYKLIFLVAFCWIMACDDPGTTTDPGTTPVQPVADSTSPPATNTDASDTATNNSVSDATPAIPEQKDCTISDSHYEKNVYVIKELAQQICILANESTKDQELGESHRILRIVNTIDCSAILEKTLPVDRSADFPYYLVPGTYEEKNQIIAIQGFSSTHYYDVKNQKLIGPIEPDFLSEKEAVDAQSGMIRGLTVWGNYLLGHCVDYGNFAFDIRDPGNPKPVLPTAEYLIPKTEEYNYLFVLETSNGLYQAILPTSDIDAGGTMFELDKLFGQPLKVNNKVAKNVQNNRFIVFNDNTNANQPRKVVVDMFSKKRVDLPANIATLKTGEVLDWLKNNQ